MSGPKSTKGFTLKPYMVAGGAILLMLTIYIVFRMHISESRLIPISVMALIAGVLIEGKRLSGKWHTVWLSALGSFVASFLAFIPSKGEHEYNFESHIEIWPYSFIFIFAMVSIIFHGEKIIPKLTEGTTLLQSIAVIYWVIDYGFITSENWLLRGLMMTGLLFSFYSLFHAVTRVSLSRTSRLTLSIWSSIIMMLFGFDNIYRVYQNEQIESAADFSQALYTGVQYFLLGISSIYILQTFLMLTGFMPGKQTFFNGQYFHDLKELKDTHVRRYSEKQIDSMHSLFCIIFTGTVYVLNYYYQMLPRHIAIWLVFVIFPCILRYMIMPKNLKMFTKENL
jgi:hypothetical protein